MKKIIYFLTFSFNFIFINSAQAQVPQAAGVVNAVASSKDVIDFYEAAVKNPIQIVVLSSEIKQTFANSPDRYKGLNNEVARSLRYFESGPFGLENIELRPEPSSGHPYWNYSITLKQLKLKQCEMLAKNQAVNVNFIRVELNGKSIFTAGKQFDSDVACESQWFFQDGKNEIKYVGY